MAKAVAPGGKVRRTLHLTPRAAGLLLSHSSERQQGDLVSRLIEAWHASTDPRDHYRRGVTLPELQTYIDGLLLRLAVAEQAVAAYSAHPEGGSPDA